jgi:hypothetical protein
VPNFIFFNPPQRRPLPPWLQDARTWLLLHFDRRLQAACDGKVPDPNVEQWRLMIDTLPLLDVAALQLEESPSTDFTVKRLVFTELRAAHMALSYRKFMTDDRIDLLFQMHENPARWQMTDKELIADLDTNLDPSTIRRAMKAFRAERKRLKII